MSAKLMKSKFVHCPSVARSSSVSIISEPNAWISFKFLFLLPLGHMQRLFFYFLNFFFFFYIFVNMGHYGSENFKMLLLPITAQSLQTSPEVYSQWSTQKYVCHGAGIRHSSVNSGFSETAAWIQV